MQVFQKEVFDIAFIDPRKKFGESGQYVREKIGHRDIVEIINGAKAQGLEIRRYVENLKNTESGIVPLKYVITDVPPGHVQPFHFHMNVDEINLVEEGEVYFVESDSIAENDHDAIRTAGVLLRAGDVVVSGQGKKHTIANLSQNYARIIGTISAQNSAKDFNPDWQR